MSLLTVAEDFSSEVSRRIRQEKYADDPVLWSREFLGINPWRAQREILYSLRDNRNTAVAAGHGVGKDLPLDTPIPTPTGWSTIGKLRVGDWVYDEAGRPCRVTGKSEVFNLPLFKTTFSDGAEVVSSGTHEWSTIDRRAAKKSRRSEGGVKDWRDHWGAAEVRETQEIKNTLHYKNGSNTTASNHIVPISGALQGSEIELPVSPYVTGAWLGDGTSVRAEITVGEEGAYILDEFRKEGYTLTKLKGKYRYSFARQGYLEFMRDRNLMNNKHIPSEYQRASVRQRKELLRGIMDTDGFHCHGTTCGIDLMNEELAHDTVELIRGLGVKASITPTRTYLDGRDVGTRYRIVFNPTWSPFTAGQYKDKAWQAKGGASFTSESRRTMRTIVSVEPTKTVPTQCIEVDSESHLYLATENLIPTHNSFIAAVAVAWWVDVHPIDKTFVATTAPSSSQLGIIWDQLRKIYSLVESRYKDGLIDHTLPGYITGDHKWKTPDGTLIGEARAPRVETIDAAFQGRHADYLLAIGDEAVGLSQGHLEALGNIATGPANRQLLLANPTNPGCFMATLWDDRITTWNRMHISVFDSPAITPDPEFELTPDMALSGMDYVEMMRETWGEDHPIYLARVCGQWAFDSEDLVFTAENLAVAQDTVVVPYDDYFPEHGWDISGPGPDYTVGYEMRKGLVWTVDPVTGKKEKPTEREGYHIRRIDKWNRTPLVSMDSSKPSTASKIHEHAVNRAASAVKVDSDGIGTSIIDGLESVEHNYTLVKYKGGMKPFNEGDYVNSRAEMYFLLRDDMVLGRIDLDPKDETLITELSGIQYLEDNRGRLQIESKKEMRKRGMKSPDHADACMYSRFPMEALDTGPQPGSEVVVDPWDYVEDESFEYGGVGYPM